MAKAKTKAENKAPAPPKGLLRAAPVEPFELQKDRQALARARSRRWAQLRRSFPAVRPDVADWAVRMEALHGPRIMVHENVLDWITALYVVRYGENEAYWPDELTDGDASRALQWERGTFAPDNTRYLTED